MRRKRTGTLTFFTRQGRHLAALVILLIPIFSLALKLNVDHAWPVECLHFKGYDIDVAKGEA